MSRRAIIPWFKFRNPITLLGEWVTVNRNASNGVGGYIGNIFRDVAEYGAELYIPCNSNIISSGTTSVNLNYKFTLSTDTLAAYDALASQSSTSQYTIRHVYSGQLGGIGTYYTTIKWTGRRYTPPTDNGAISIGSSTALSPIANAQMMGAMSEVEDGVGDKFWISAHTAVSGGTHITTFGMSSPYSASVAAPELLDELSRAFNGVYSYHGTQSTANRLYIVDWSAGYASPAFTAKTASSALDVLKECHYYDGKVYCTDGTQLIIYDISGDSFSYTTIPSGDNDNSIIGLEDELVFIYHTSGLYRDYGYIYNISTGLFTKIIISSDPGNFVMRVMKASDGYYYAVGYANTTSLTYDYGYGIVWRFSINL